MPIQAGSVNSGVTVYPGDWTGTLNGLAIGHGSNYPIVVLDGWKTQTSLPLGGAGSLAPKQTTNGAWQIPYWMPEKKVTLRLEVIGGYGTTYAAAVANLESVTQPDGASTVTLTVQLDGIPTTLTGVVSDRKIITDIAYQQGLATVDLIFTAFDPRRLSASAMSATTGLPTTSGGLSFPASFPAAFTGSVSSGVVTLTNAGPTPAPIVVTFNGNVSGPSVTQVGTGLVVAFSSSLTVNSGDTLVVNMDQRSALYNNQAQATRNGYITQRGWMSLQPGSNSFQFNATGGTGTMTVQAWSAWL